MGPARRWIRPHACAIIAGRSPSRAILPSIEECSSMIAATTRRPPQAWIYALALMMTAPGEALAQAGNEWVGKRVITRFGATLQVDGRVVEGQRSEATPSGGSRTTFWIYRVEHANGPWLWLKAERIGLAGWVKAEWVIPYEQAVDYFTNEIRANPDNSSAYIRRAQIWKDRKEYDVAIADFSEAIRLDPGSEVCWVARGVAWSDMKDFDRAIADYAEAIRIDPKYAAVYNNRAYAWAEKREYDRAIADCSEAIRLDPRYSMAFNNRGRAWAKKKEYDRAIADFEVVSASHCTASPS